MVQVGPWDDWQDSFCSCRAGYLYRERAVIVPRRYGGIECPPLMDVAPCHNAATQCEINSGCHAGEWNSWYEELTAIVILAVVGGVVTFSCPPIWNRSYRF